MHAAVRICSCPGWYDAAIVARVSCAWVDAAACRMMGKRSIFAVVLGAALQDEKQHRGFEVQQLPDRRK